MRRDMFETMRRFFREKIDAQHSACGVSASTEVPGPQLG